VDGSIAIIGKCGAGGLPLSLIGRGSGYVAAQWGEIAVVGVYFSPNRDLAHFSAYLDRLATVIRRQQPGPVLVAGDLNSK